ncbi:MAG: hypothetical protein WBJ41_18595 [Chromatiaceae bacterium]
MSPKFRQLISEPSTWRGLIWMATAAGLAVSPDQQAAIVAAGMALAGIVGAFFTDNKP